MSESTCLIDQGIVVKGAAFLGFTVRTIAISPPGVDCPTFPFGAAPLNARLVVCGVDLSTVVKVTFVGTDKVAWMRLVTNGRSGQLVAIVDSFAIPLEPPQTVP